MKRQLILIFILVLSAIATVIFVNVKHGSFTAEQKTTKLDQMPVKNLHINGHWEINWYKQDQHNTNRPIEYLNKDSGNQEVYPSQTVLVSLNNESLQVTFLDKVESSTCAMQGQIIKDNEIKLSYVCDNPKHEIKTATMHVKIEPSYMPEQFVMQGQWQGKLDDGSIANGRVELLSKF